MAVRTTRSRAAAAQKPKQLSSPPATPVPARPSNNGVNVKKRSPEVKQESPMKQSTAKSSRKRTSTQVKDEPEDLPHGLGHQYPTTSSGAPPKKKAKKQKATTELAKQLDDPGNQAIAQQLKAEFANAGTAEVDAASTNTKKGKKNTAYGHTPGNSPFPGYLRPTPEECEEVAKLLSSVHGKVKVQKEVKTGRMDVAGCGEVPHVLDALVRTRLSANTSNTNSNRAFQGIVRRFGTIKDRAGREMVDWNAVRLAPQKELFLAIEKGGLANVKSRDIKNILDMVYAENQQRRAALQSADKTADGEDRETNREKAEEIERIDEDVISLDHVHLLGKEEAFNKLITYPGIGAKTASCVVLFCLQRPSFAVDTHVWRLCNWLGWVPRGATRDQTFSHCEVRIPDELKYPLHYLLIKHGKLCSKCRAKGNRFETEADGEGADEEAGEGEEKLGKNCVIEHLVKRFKHKEVSPKKARGTPKKRQMQEEAAESELSELSGEEEG